MQKQRNHFRRIFFRYNGGGYFLLQQRMRPNYLKFFLYEDKTLRTDLSF